MKVSIFHNAGDFSYLFGLVNGLAKSQDIEIDVIDSSQSIKPFEELNNVKVFEFILPFKNTLNPIYRLYRIFSPYIKNILYAFKTDSKVFHIQWFNRFHTIDKIFLINFYHLLNKRVVYTAHNVNTLERNNADNIWNRLTLKYFYKKVDHIIVHNNKSKSELVKKFNVNTNKISIIKFGLNIFTPQKGITKEEAVSKLNLPTNKKIILFFGAIHIYKGLEFLLDAYKQLITKSDNYHLVIAGDIRDKNYFTKIKELIINNFKNEHLSTFFRFIEEDEIEYFFTAADCLVLPYRSISQSGVHFLSYSFGLPVLASDVGSFKEEDIIPGKTGFIFKAEDSNDLKKTIIKYFDSELYKDIDNQRSKIKNWALGTYNWDNIAITTINCYKKLISNE